MIDVFFRREATDELMHPRVTVVQLHDYEQASDLISLLRERGVAVEGRPARLRGTVAQLVARRDAALDRELDRLAVARRRAALRSVP